LYDARQKPASKKANAHACARYRAASAARRERRARRCSAPKAKGRPELSAVGNRTKVSCAPHVARQSEVARGARNFRPEHRRSPPISRVLLRRAMSRAMTVIPLGPPLPTGSSRLPADSASSVVVRLFGVAPDGGCRVSPAPKKGSDSSLWPCSSPSRRPRGLGYVRPGVTRHPALWSPDFPLPRNESGAATIWQASQRDYNCCG